MAKQVPNSWGTDQYNATVVKQYGNTYVIALDPLPVSYSNGMQVRFKATTDSTGQLQIILKGLTVDKLESIPVVNPDGTTTASGDILNGQLISVLFDSATDTFVLHSFPQQPYVAPARFTSTPSVFPGGSGVVTAAHGLGAKPFLVWAVAIQTNASAQQGYAQNDEVSLWSFISNTANSSPAFAVSCDATNITIAQDSNNNIFLIPKGGGSKVQITNNNWSVKVYATL